MRRLSAVNGDLSVWRDAALLRGPPRANAALPGRPLIFEDAAAAGKAAVAVAATEALALARAAPHACPTNMSGLECSGAGDCDCATGTCVCDAGAAGAACNIAAASSSPSSVASASASSLASASGGGGGGGGNDGGGGGGEGGSKLLPPGVIAAIVIGVGAALAAVAATAASVVRHWAPARSALDLGHNAKRRPAEQLESARLLPEGGRTAQTTSPSLSTARMARAVETRFSLQL